ncbi:MAG: hypothetical protein ACKVWV_16490 [Planctomycetota bacterium]
MDDVDSYVSVPDGIHVCRIAEVREGRARDGSVRWTFRLEVVDGEWAGRTAAWDSITWSERGVYRVKKVLEALGMDVRGELEVEPNDLVSLVAQVKVEPEEREDPLTGRRQVRMRVPYLGYAPAEGSVERPVERNGAARRDHARSHGRGKQDDEDATAPIDGDRSGDVEHASENGEERPF